MKTLLFISRKYWLGNKPLLLQLYAVIVLATAGLFCACLYGRSSTLAELETILDDSGNYDISVAYPNAEIAAYLEADTRFTESSKVYRTGSVSPTGKKDLSAGLGYFENELAIDMFHLPLLEGRYPEREGELCADKRTLQSWGYAARTGEKISLCLYDESGSFVEEREYLLTGVLEVTANGITGDWTRRTHYRDGQFEAESYIPPMCYLSREEGEKSAGVSGADFIFLGNIDYADEDDETDIKMELLDKFKGVYLNAHIGGHRSGAAFKLLTRGAAVTSGSFSPGFNLYEKLIASGEYLRGNFYNAFLIPCFTVLLILLTVCSVYSVLHLMLQKRSVQLGTLRAVGMSMGQVAAMLILEAFLFLVSGVAAGYLFGAGIYTLSLKLQEVLFGQKVFYAFFLDSFWGRYIKMVTYSPARLPWMVTALTVAAVMSFYFAGHINDRPLDMIGRGKARIKRRSRGRGLGASLMGGWHAGLLFLLTIMTGAVSFGYFSCRCQAAKEADSWNDLLKQVKVDTYEYVASMGVQETLFGYEQMLHENGLDAARAQALADDGAVETYLLCAVNASSKLVYEPGGKKDTFLAGGSVDYTKTEDIPVDDYRAERMRLTWQYRGFPDPAGIYQVPTIALAQENLSLLAPYVVRGEIHPDKLASGEEVILLAKEEAVCDYFTVGEMLPLADVVFGELDDKTEMKANIVPDDLEPAALVDGIPLYVPGTRLDFPSRVGAIAVLDEAGQKIFYSSLPVPDSGVRIASTLSALEAFGLPDHNYTNFYVNLKKDGDRAAFEGKWYSLLASGDGMSEYCLTDVRKGFNSAIRASMMIFYSLFILLFLIGSVSICNLITVMLYNGRKKTAIVRAAGGSAGRIRGMILKRLLCYPLFAGGIGALLLYGYTGIAWYAQHLREEEHLLIVNGQYPPEWYWHFPIQYFWRYPLHRFLIGVTALIAAALLLFAVKRLTALLRRDIPEELGTE